MQPTTATLLVAGFGAALGLFRLLRPSNRDSRPKCVLITGAGAGLGRATAIELLRRGDTVIGLDISADGLKTVEDQFQSNFIGVQCNVGDPASVAAAAAKVKARSNGAPCIDCIINFAGLIRGGPLVEMEDRDMQAIVSVNVLGTFLINKYFFPLLRRKQKDYTARIINTASEVAYARLSAAFNGPYSATKSAVYDLSVALRQELNLLRKPVAVLTLVPGAFATEMTRNAAADFDAASSKPQTLFYRALSEGGKSAEGYMSWSKLPPEYLGKRLCDVVHQRTPESNLILCNVSLVMFGVQFCPQALMDGFMRLMFCSD